MKITFAHKKYFLIMLAGIALILTAEYLGFFVGMNNYCYDLFFRLRDHAQPDKRIVIAAVDEHTLDQLGRWPLRRIHYARLLDRLEKADVVGLDILMVEPSEDDAFLAEAVEKHGRVVFPTYIVKSPQMVDVISLFSPSKVGHVHLEQDIDGIVREVYHTLYVGDRKLISFESAIYEIVTGKAFLREDRAGTKKNLLERSRIVQMDARRINYYGPSGTFPCLSLADIIEGRYPADFFKDRIVLIGVTAVGLEAGILTPFSQQRDQMNGVEVHANILNNLLDCNIIVEVPDLIRWVFSALFSFLGLFLFLRMYGRWTILLWGLGIAVMSLATFALFILFRLWFSPVLFCFFFSFMFIEAYVFRLEQTGKQLGEAKEEWEESFNTINDAIILRDYSCAVIRTNVAAGTMLEPHMLEILARKCLQEVPGSANGTKRNNHVEPAREPVMEDILDSVTGRYFEVKTLPRFDKGDQPIGFVQVVRDVTDRKRAEQALRESEEKYRNIFENAIEGIFQSTPEGRFLNISPAYSRMYDYTSPQEMMDNVADIGQQLYVNPEDCKAFKEILEEKGIIERFEVQHYKKNGDKIWVSINALLLRDVKGENIFNGFTEDITQQKIAEDEKKILESQLRQAQKMEAIGTLAGGIAHDFNNILSAVIGYTELAMMAPGKEKRQYHLNQVLKASERAKTLVNQILSFSRQREQERKPVEVSIVCKEAIKLLRASLPATIEIRHVIASDRTTVSADPTQIHQVLMNLCTNAAHAMREKGGVIDIGLVHEKIDASHIPHPLNLTVGDYVKLTVSDTGHGIASDIIERIFEPFFTTKGPGEGTGLGLSVVYGIVKNHGGRIDLSSEAGKGTTISVYLPLIDTEEQKHEQAPETIPVGSERILFVDDEAALVEVGTSVLASLGYHVTAIASSTEALVVFRARPHDFDLVITDMTMPNMRGDDLAVQLLRIRPDIPIILCTGFSEAISEEKAKRLGIRQLLMKPLFKKDLAEAIRKALQIQR